MNTFATAWTDTTDLIVSATPVFLNSVRVRVNPDSTAASYVQLFDSADATPGTTAPNDVIYVPAANVAGRQLEYHVAYNGKYYATGLTWVVTTTHDGATAATTHAPLRVDIDYNKVG
ncbi:MAG TPA: hypothetical protein VJ816_06050 [Gemmatimonadales bacterium]|nr:hypothetical protein [Gemmatimonadales bacterium]